MINIFAFLIAWPPLKIGVNLSFFVFLFLIGSMLKRKINPFKSNTKYQRLFWSFLILGILKSPVLKPLNLIWFKFGLFLGKFIAPIVMGIVYFIVVFPTSLLLKLFKKNYLNIKYEKNINSYWINVKSKNTTMKNQF